MCGGQRNGCRGRSFEGLLFISLPLIRGNEIKSRSDVAVVRRGLWGQA
jgi:hypothetical protein